MSGKPNHSATQAKSLASPPPTSPRAKSRKPTKRPITAATRCQPSVTIGIRVKTAKMANPASKTACRKLGMVKLAISHPAAAISTAGTRTSTTNSGIITVPLCNPPRRNTTAATRAAAAFSSQVGQSLLERTGNCAEGRRQFRTNGRNRADDNHCDEGGDQTVFDRGHARLVTDETRNKVLH